MSYVVSFFHASIYEFTVPFEGIMCVFVYYTGRRIMSNVAIGHCGHTNDCGLIASNFTCTKLISWIMGIIIFRKNTIY
jgi:hypothetical protein